MNLVAGTRLGSYEILGPLGAGGMGEVYRAKDLRLGREVAVKVLPAEVASSPDRLARFEREARTVAGLSHPNIVVLHTVEDVDGVRFLTMELVEGQTLSTFVSPGGLPLAKLIELAIPLTDALVAAHEKGVIHRDLKPGNVMVTREGRGQGLGLRLPQMMGVDAPAAQGASFTMTADGPISGEGQVVGTVPYMAPEQLRGEAVDARSDLFSLGIILYELATGRRPFTGETSIDVSHAILRDTPEPLSRVRTDLPGDLTTLIDHCLQKSPRERVQTALDVNNALRRLRKVLERGEPEKPASDKVASIAVLPFANRSASADDEYFSDGLADELLGVLSKIKGLRVTARSSAFTFKGRQVTAAEIGSALNVSTLLEGSVRKAGNRIRVSVQLVQVSDSSHLWSETYDRTLEDIFAVQEDIAHSVVKELRATLLGSEADSDASGQAKAEVAQAAGGRGTDPESHRLCLQARHLLDRRSRQDVLKAIEYLNEAISRDSDNVSALVELARGYLIAAGLSWLPADEGYDQARKAAERALVLDPKSPHAHLWLAQIELQHGWDWRAVETSYRRAAELAPEDPQVLSGLSTLATFLGRLDEAIDLNQRALQLDPLNSTAYQRLGLRLQEGGRFVEAEAALRKALELAPQRAATHDHLALALLSQGRTEEALATALQEPEEWARLWSLSIIHRAAGRREESNAMLRGLIEKYGRDASYQIAEAYAAFGEADPAFEWLERAYAQRDPGLTLLRGSPHLDRLVGDPRWGAFLKKMGLAD